MSNAIWKLSEDEEKENDYKRLQKKFAFLSSNNPNKKSKKLNTINENSVTFDSRNSSNEIQRQREFIETSQSLRIEDINKIIEKNEKISSKLEPQINNIRLTNRLEIYNKNTLTKTISRQRENSIVEEETERNMNKYVDNFDNNPGLADAVRKMTESSIDSIRESSLIQDTNSKHMMNINIRLPSYNMITPSEDFNDSQVLDGKKNNLIIFNKNINNSNNLSNADSYIDSFSQQSIYFKKGKNNPFFHNPVYNLSSRLINDEKDHNKTIAKDFKFKFIDKIEENKKTKLKINARNFLKLSDSSFFNFLTFSYDYYEKLITSNNYVEFKLHTVLANTFNKVIEDFRMKYKTVIELQEYYFKYELVRKRRFEKSGHVLNLVLRSKILPNYIDKNVEITLFYKFFPYKDHDNSELMHSWSFDIRKRNEIPYWIASEAEEYQHDIVRYSYIQPILAVSKDDFIEFHLSVFSSNGIMDPSGMNWRDVRITECPGYTFIDYEKKMRKSNIKFDKLRFCELENMIHIWKSEESLTLRKSIDEVRKIFSKLFKINSISFDFFKFYIFKVKMIAHTKGSIKRNKYINFDIEIKGKDDNISYEIRALGLLNHKNNKLDIREGTPIILYFTDIYL